MNSYTLADISPGLTADFTLEVTAEKMALFYELTGDCSPIHMDEAYAQRRGYPGRVVYGMLGASLFSTLAGVYLPVSTACSTAWNANSQGPCSLGMCSPSAAL